MFRAPGLPFLRPSSAGPDTGARLLLRDSVVWSAVCFPALVRTANAGAVPRPPGEPGNQSFIGEVAQDGCVPATNSSAYAAAALLSRCHPAGRMALVDYALAGAVVGVSQNAVPAHYSVVLKNITGLCRSVLSMSCISTFTAIGCFLAAMNNYTAPADVLTSASEGGGGGGSVYGATPADGGSGGGSGDSGDGADTVLLAGLLGGLGGVLVLLAVVGGVLWVRRRRRDAAYRAAAQRQHGTSKGDVVAAADGPDAGHQPPSYPGQGNSDGTAVVRSTTTASSKTASSGGKGSMSTAVCGGGAVAAAARPLSEVVVLDGSGVAGAGGKAPQQGDGGKDGWRSGVTAKTPTRNRGSTGLLTSEVGCTRTRSGSSAAGLVVGADAGGASGSKSHVATAAAATATAAGFGSLSQPHPAQAQAQVAHPVAKPQAPLDYDSVVALHSPINIDMALDVLVVERDTVAVASAAAAEGGSGDGAASPRVAAAAGAAGVGADAGSNVLTLLPTLRGRGAFGRVVEGVYQGQRVAVKLLTPAGLSQELSDDLRASFRQEVAVLGRCQHDNVVRLLAASINPKQLCLVMELCECSLEKLIYSGTLMPLPKVLHIAAQVAAGLVYLHPTIMHRDLGGGGGVRAMREGCPLCSRFAKSSCGFSVLIPLTLPLTIPNIKLLRPHVCANEPHFITKQKPANVLINGADTDTPIAKLTDFGLARMRSVTMPTLNPEAGTPAYMAPECYDVNNDVITSKADVFSLGALLWTCLSGREPWAGQNMVQVAVAITVHRQRLPLSALPEERCPPKLRRLIEACWEHDPLRRPAAAEVHKELLVVLEQVTSGSANGPGKPIPCVTGALVNCDHNTAGDTSLPPPRVLANLRDEQEQPQEPQQQQSP
ncbi:hypothetical protein CHLRE_03g151300v5 [Chlamydomonas reinhardtii]|nr:uncharacterized protein CHLRE_03g151300v5 [Chlamydomonas reinhardtii]PNW84613.1 hypothetical protein CHLRE_03g151300v5 [Chlamydomonas reinhardtii]